MTVEISLKITVLENEDKIEIIALHEKQDNFNKT
jgi:hypothetical protein